MHYQRLRRHGGVNVNLRGEPVLGVCSVIACDGPAYCKGLCHGHYKRSLEGRALDSPVRERNSPTPEGKRCPGCKKFKPLSDFNKKGPTGEVVSRCKPCTKIQRRRMFYGMSEDEYLLHSAAGCAVCGRPEPLVVDHCHHSGLARGVLCSQCNVAIGMAGDDPARLVKMATYLERTTR